MSRLNLAEPCTDPLRGNHSRTPGMRFGLALGSLAAALWSLACSAQAVAPPEAPGAEPTQTAEVKEPGPVPRVMIQAGAVFVDEQRVDVLEADRPTRRKKLAEMLAERTHGKWQQESFPLRFEPSAKTAELYAVMQAAAAGKYSNAELTTFEGRVRLYPVLPPARAGEPDSVPRLEYPEEMLVLASAGDVVSVQRLGQGDAPVASRLKTIAQVQSYELESGVISALADPALKEVPMSPMLLVVGPEDTAEVVERLIAVALDFANSTVEVPLLVQLRFGHMGEVGGRPVMKIGTVNTSPELQPASLNMTLKTNSGGLSACHNEALERDPGLTGHVDMELSVDPKGRVTDARVRPDFTLSDPELGNCLQAQMQSWNVPLRVPRAGTVTVPMRFLPGG